MIQLLVPSKNPIALRRTNLGRNPTSVYPSRPVKLAASGWKRPIACVYNDQNRRTTDHPKQSGPRLITRVYSEPIVVSPGRVTGKNEKRRNINVKGDGEKKARTGGGFTGQLGWEQMLVLCGFGCWMQGFRGFPWLGLNFHMANNLNLHPSLLQLVQHAANLPMVAKPLYGLLSDAIYIGGAHRIPYIQIGVCLQVLAWGSLALFPGAQKALPILMACILLSNVGASVTEVATDALVAEYGQKHRIGGLQSYAFMALAIGGVLGNLLGGIFLQKTAPKTMFVVFAFLLSLQLASSSVAKEESLGLSQEPDPAVAGKSLWESIAYQISNLKMALSDDRISRPLMWMVASIAMVPVLSGSVFCYQTQCLNLDPSVIGLSKVIGQLMLLSMTVLFDRYWKELPMRKLVGTVQIVYAASLLLDFVLVRQINLRIGIPNELFALCFSGLAETLAQFKLLPFSVLLASLCPQGCEGSLTSFLASAFVLSSIISGFLGVGLASLVGVTSTNYSRLPVGILIQFLLALIPLAYICNVPMSESVVKKEKRKGASKRARKARRIGRVMINYICVYRRERDPGWKP
ncbi:Probable folate-biopterin transporter 9, chloroplastic [Linum grandiflorum]